MLGGDFNVAPTDARRLGPGRLRRHDPRLAARARRPSHALLDWGLDDVYRRYHPEPGRFTWWDYRAGNFHKDLGMRIDHLLVTEPRRRSARTGAEIDRDARKGKLPSDHAPLYLDLA